MFRQNVNAPCPVTSEIPSLNSLHALCIQAIPATFKQRDSLHSLSILLKLWCEAASALYTCAFLKQVKGFKHLFALYFLTPPRHLILQSHLSEVRVALHWIL
jgi:hypothetical protein